MHSSCSTNVGTNVDANVVTDVGTDVASKCSTNGDANVNQTFNIKRTYERTVRIPDNLSGPNGAAVENFSGPISDHGSLGALLTSDQLQGLSYRNAECYGKPHINAHYTADDVDRYVHDEVDCLMDCGNRATNAHHVPPKGVSRQFLLKTKTGIHVLKPALFAVCGSGTTGCHRRFHAHEITVEWRWKTYEDFFSWWDGSLLTHLFPHDSALFDHGYWRITDGKTGESFTICE